MTCCEQLWDRRAAVFLSPHTGFTTGASVIVDLSLAVDSVAVLGKGTVLEDDGRGCVFVWSCVDNRCASANICVLTCHYASTSIVRQGVLCSLMCFHKILYPSLVNPSPLSHLDELRGRFAQVGVGVQRLLVCEATTAFGNVCNFARRFFLMTGGFGDSQTSVRRGSAVWLGFSRSSKRAADGPCSCDRLLWSDSERAFLR